MSARHRHSVSSLAGRLALAALLTTVVAAGCGEVREADASADAEAADGLAPAGAEVADEFTAAVDSLEIAYARQAQPGLLTAGQLTPEQVAALEELGFSHFINLRTEGESGTGWEEELILDSSYLRIPVMGADGLTRENVDLLAAALEGAGDEPTVLYCGSSNRVGALLALKAYWLDGADPETALELGRAGGLTRLEPNVKEILGLEEGE